MRDTMPCGIPCRAGDSCRAGHEKVSSFDRTRGRGPDALASKGQERRRIGCASGTARTIGQSRVVPAIEKDLEPIRVRSEPAALPSNRITLNRIFPSPLKDTQYHRVRFSEPRRSGMETFHWRGEESKRPNV